MSKLKNRKIKKPKKNENPKLKKVKFVLKIASLGLAVTLVGKSALAQLEFNTALNNATKSGRPNEISVLTGDEKKKQLKEYYENAINANKHLKEDQKELLIKSFSEIVLDKWYEVLDEKTIANLYAVSSTERFRNTTNVELNHGWWTGDFNSLFNSMQVVKDDDGEVASHEQVHAMTRGNAFTVGLSRPRGYGMNEGVTSFVNSDNSYMVLTKYSIMIGHIIGYDRLLNSYFNHDLDSIINGLSEYLDESKVMKIIDEMDKIVFYEYFAEFSDKNIKSDGLFELLKRDYEESKEKIQNLLDEAQKTKNENGKVKTVENVFEDYNLLGEKFYYTNYSTDIKKYFRLMETIVEKSDLQYLVKHSELDFIFEKLEPNHGNELKNCFQVLIEASEKKADNYETIRINTAKIFMENNRFNLSDLIKNHLNYNMGSIYGPYYEPYMIQIENALSINNLGEYKDSENYDLIISNFCKYMTNEEKDELIDLLEKNFSLGYFDVNLDEEEQARLDVLMQYISKQKYDYKQMLDDYQKNPELFMKVYGEAIFSDFKDLEWIIFEENNLGLKKTGLIEGTESFLDEEERDCLINKIENSVCGEQQRTECQYKIYNLCMRKNENLVVDDGKNLYKLLVTKSMIKPVYAQCYNKNNVFDYIDKIEQIIGDEKIKTFYDYKISAYLEKEIKQYISEDEYNELNSNIVKIMNGELGVEDRTDELIIKMCHNSGQLELEESFRKITNKTEIKDSHKFSLEEISKASKENQKRRMEMQNIIEER